MNCHQNKAKSIKASFHERLTTASQSGVCLRHPGASTITRGHRETTPMAGKTWQPSHEDWRILNWTYSTWTDIAFKMNIFYSSIYNKYYYYCWARLQNSRFRTFLEGAKRRKRDPRGWSARACHARRACEVRKRLSAFHTTNPFYAGAV